ncbi:nucleotidyl transferase AbiEii/AbiGii toxin family protein [Patescibacteria group bacterium AH-259-L05]|nr:nucleotidyl transferase AbiEii/AbiGii toxin family protein [Patescibacteria group bacterium AH-259-L05]
MISAEEVKRLSARHQTSTLNIAREYVQNCFLSEFYKLKNSDRLLFKGGTALRLIYQSPRYSRDIDFTGINNIRYREIEDLLMETLANLNAWGFELEIIEAKKTTGGYLSKINFSFSDFSLILVIEISFRIRKQKSRGTVSRVKNEYIPHYDVYQVPQSKLIDGKLSALLARAKARDWYDLYFLLRANILEAKHKKLLPGFLEKLKRSQTDFRKGIKEFLPISHQIILKDFKSQLIKEIKRFV